MQTPDMARLMVIDALEMPFDEYDQIRAGWIRDLMTPGIKAVSHGRPDSTTS